MIVLYLFLHSVLPFSQQGFMLCTSYGVFFVDFVNISVVLKFDKSKYFAIYYKNVNVILSKNKKESLKRGDKQIVSLLNENKIRIRYLHI